MMENLDIIVLSSIVTVLFGVFIYVVLKELTKPEGQYTPTEDNGPRSKMIKKVGSIFDTVVEEPKIKRKRKPKETTLKTV